MDKSLFDKYIKEMRTMKAAATLPTQNSLPTVTKVTDADENSEDMTGLGYLIVNVTSVRGLYPINGAKVTVFTGSEDNMTVIAEEVTDRSGKTPPIPLEAPSSVYTQTPDPTERPYSYYNIRTVEDGFKTNLNYNVAVFDKITSVQNINLEPMTSQIEQNRPIIIDEFENYTL